MFFSVGILLMVDGKPVIYYCAYLYLVGVLLFLVLKVFSVFSSSASFAVLQVFQEQFKYCLSVLS